MSTTHLPPPPRPWTSSSLAAAILLVLAVLPATAAIVLATDGPPLHDTPTESLLPGWFLPVPPRPRVATAEIAPWRGLPVSAPATRGSDDICSSLSTATCNSIVHFNTRDPAGARATWDDYDCVDDRFFPPHTLVYSETGYTVALTGTRDLALSVPLVTGQEIDGVWQDMNIFAGIFSACDDGACLAGSETRDSATYRHAIKLAAPAGIYTTIIDSDNMVGAGDMIIACGDSDPGWCASAVRADLACGTYTIEDTTLGAPDNIIHYDTGYWPAVYAYDGPERVYRIQLNGARVFSLILRYDGNLLLPYNSYMSYFLLDSTCDQHRVIGYPLPPNYPFVGEGFPTTTGGSYVLGPGTYYLVIDGMHLPQGDDFSIAVECRAASLPLMLADEAGPP